MLHAAADRLRAAGCASPRVDVEELAAHVLGVQRADLLRIDDLGAATGIFEALLERRIRREPLQHLTGTVGFRHLELAVGPGVFVPRPETESVVQWALDRLAGRVVCVDLCAGSGAIALSIAQEHPGAVVHAVERSPVAASWARRNIAAKGLDVTLHVADAADALPQLDGLVDLVISNPPYVAENETVDIEVAHDPRDAVYAGGDGLAVLRVVATTAGRLLRPGGLLVVEHSDRQGRSAPAVLDSMTGYWTEVDDCRDLAGRDRFVTARRAAAGTRTNPATAGSNR